MKNKEDILRSKFGKEYHFLVPDNYFEDFARRIMTQIPDNVSVCNHAASRTLFSKIKPYLYMAAMFVGLCFCINIVKYHSGNIERQASHKQSAYVENTDQYVDDLCDFAGIDDEQIYAYVTGNDAIY